VLWNAACAAKRVERPVREPGASVVASDPRACVEPAAPGEPSLAQATGRLSAQVIEGVATAELGALRACYQRALERAPAIAGQINVHFVIGVDGHVTHARAEHNNLPDCGAVRCVLEAFGAMRFPAPEGGSVHVVYPILLAPR
jgi:hypothetical protein